MKGERQGNRMGKINPEPLTVAPLSTQWEILKHGRAKILA